MSRIAGVLAGAVGNVCRVRYGLDDSATVSLFLLSIRLLPDCRCAFGVAHGPER